MALITSSSMPLSLSPQPGASGDKPLAMYGYMAVDAHVKYVY